MYIGIIEKLDESLLRISKKLNFEYVGDSKHVNRMERTNNISEEVREQFLERHELEYLVYNFVKKQFDKS